MKKRIFWVSLLMGVVLLMTLPVLAQDKVIKWKVQGFVPAGMLFHDALERLAEEVKKATGGRLVFEVYPAGALVPGSEGLKAVSDGAYQANFGAASLWAGQIPAAPLFTSVPGGFGAMAMQMWLNEGGGKQLWQEMYDTYKFNVKVIPAACVGMEDFQWAKKPLKKLEDFKGVKMRMMPLMGDVLAAHGLSVIWVSPGEIMPNLQRAVLDAAEYSIPAVDKTIGLWEVCKYVMLPGIHQPCTQLELLINKQAYEALPPDLKLALQSAVDASRINDALWMEQKSLEAVAFFKEKGVTIVNMEPETVKTFVKWAHDYLDEQGKKNPFFGKVWDSQKKYGAVWYPYEKAFTLDH